MFVDPQSKRSKCDLRSMPQTPVVQVVCTRLFAYLTLYERMRTRPAAERN